MEIWVNAVDKWEVGARTFRITKDSGRGIIITSNEAWKNYKLQIYKKSKGLNRYYGQIQLIKVIK